MSGSLRLSASVFALGIIAHLNSLGGGFHYDDAHSIVENPHVRSLRHIPIFFVDPAAFSSEPAMAMYRPLVTTTYALTYALAGYTAWPYLLFNVVAHSLVAAVVVLLLAERTGRAGLAWWAGAVFALHPINAQVANYISSRSESMAVLGMLAALYFIGRRAQGTGALAYVLGLLSKSIAVVGVPLVWLWRPRFGGSRAWLPWLGITAVYGGLIVANQFLTRSLAQDVRAYSVQLYTQIKALVYYLYLIAVPVHLSVEHPFAESRGLEAVVVAAALLALSLIWLAYRARRTGVGVGLAIFFVGLALPFFFPLNVLVNEHRVYLSGFGLLCALVSLFGRIGPGTRWVAWCGLCVLAALGWQRNAVWADEYSLWSAAAVRAPDSFRVQSNLGLALYERGELESAHRALSRALELNPGYARTWNNWGLVLEGMGEYEAAEQALGKALELRPDLVGSHANLGRLYIGTGRYGEAIRSLEQALDIDPGSVAARTNLGLAHQRAGRLELAVAAYERAMQGGPLTAEAHNNLGLAYQDLGRLDEAERALAAAAELDPDNPTAGLNLRMLRLRREGRDAVAVYEAVTGEYPTHPDLWRRLAAEYAGRGQLDAAIAACRRVIELVPDDRQAAVNLELLLAKQRGE